MTRSRFAIFTLLAALAGVGLSGTPAVALVSCGATIIADTTLTSSDPVTTTICTSNGISIGADNITLDCGGLTIRGQAVGAGIRLVSGASGATIQNCVVDGFAKGLLLGGAGGTFVLNVVVQNNKDNGVEASSDFNFFQTVVSRKNGGFGLHLSGIGNGTAGAIALQNTKAGFSISGQEADIETSLSISNGNGGFTGNMKSSFFAANIAIGNTGLGFDMATGTVLLPNEYDENKALANTGNGLVVGGTNIDANVDGGGNVGLANGGAIQCEIAAVACQ